MSNKKLIVNADDFGQSEGVNNGVIRSYEKGIVTSASLMVRYPAAISAAAYAKKNPALGVGLHIDLGEWIYNDGNWDALYEVVSLDDVKAVEVEIKNQLESFYRIMGRKPTHIDSHQHVHLRESIRPVVINIAGELNITLRRCSDKVNYCGDFYGQLTDGSAFHQAISVSGLKGTLLKLPKGITELACHPGLNNDLQTMYTLEREIEVDTLCERSIREEINLLDIELCSFEGITF
jgi:chitin disaccharide deacetylase